MKKVLFSVLIVVTGGYMSAQRYVSKVFTEVKVTSDVTYGTNVDFLTSDLTDQGQIATDITAIKTAMAMQDPIPAHFYNPSDTASNIKVTDLKMDVYEPMNDSLTDRPVVIYIHTGNFLPPPLNGSPTGRKVDSTAVHVCKEWAKRGYVAVAISYRLGWNPIASGPTGEAVRRGTLLNAVYRAIHDVKQSVRVLKADAETSNTYGIDGSKIILYGQGSGGYVALAYATMDKYAEITIDKFIGPDSKPYVDTVNVGNLEGTNGILNLYAANGQSTDVDFVVNAGGAMADTSWLEAGDVPMVSFHCVRDPFAPFNEGTVRVPTTLEDVVDVQGAGVFMVKANALGNNDVYQSISYNDPYTMAARSSYGNTYSYIFPAPFDEITVSSEAEGLFPFLRPKGATQFQNEGSPWDWWNPNDPISQAVVDQQTGATAHQAGLRSNPDMSPAKGKAYVDTIMGYSAVRIAVALELSNIGLDEFSLSSNIDIYPNPVNDFLNIRSKDRDIEIEEALISDISGRKIMEIQNPEMAPVWLGDMKAGVYLLSVKANGKTFTERIVKQ